MSQKTTPTLRVQAEALITVTGQVGNMSPAQREMIVDAIAEDLGVASDRQKAVEDRLAKLETQSRVGAEAVMAIASNAEAMAVAAQAVQTEMSDAAPIAAQTPIAADKHTH
jgi:hypothetical protein